jgi:hypothetical protein
MEEDVKGNPTNAAIIVSRPKCKILFRVIAAQYLLYDSLLMKLRHFISNVSGESDDKGVWEGESGVGAKMPARRSIFTLL